MTAHKYNADRLRFAVERFELDRQWPPIGNGCCIDGGVEIGHGTVIGHNVVIRENTRIGRNCLIKSNSVIGEKGFGFAHTKDLTPVEIVHTGGVIIGDSVEVGELCVVQAGTVDPTIVEDHVKIDTHVHIGHNCHIGEKSLLCSGVVLGGGVKIGKLSFLGLGATIKNKITIAEDTLVGQQANVVKDTRPHAVVMGNPAREFIKETV
jgi:UDP-3-O-[3-hydroxymyristoyl] glucosamine N-acyltransferase LpxD